MAYKHDDKSSGQLIRSADWNAMGHEIERLETDKLNRSGDTIKGDLTVSGKARFDSLTVTGEAGITGKVLGPLAVSGDFGVSGKARIGALTVTGDAEIAGKVRVSSLTVTGDSSVSGKARFDALSVTGDSHFGGDAQFDGNLKVAGTIYAGGYPLGGENYEIYLRGSAYESPEGNTTFLKVANIPIPIEPSRGLNTVVLNPNGTFKNKASHDVYENISLWNGWADWVNENASKEDIVAVAAFEALRNAPGCGSAEKLLSDVGAFEAFTAEKGSTRSPYALLFVRGYGAIEVSNSYKGPNAHIKASYYQLLNLNRDVIAAAGSPFRRRMYPLHPLIYQDIFSAKAAGAIAKIGNPQYDETTYTGRSPWYDRPLIKFGANNDADGNGALVIVPDGYDTLWLRVLGDRWTALKAYFTDGAQEQVGIFTGGYRSANCYCPDGSLTDSHFDRHQWMPIPAGRSGKIALTAKPGTTSDFWLSALAFSRNPWKHATQSAVGYHWASNGGDGTHWESGWENWNADILSCLMPKTNWELRVPVIPSGRDKLLYVVEHNNNWNGCMHTGIVVNQTPIERFIATYDNPFARHWSSKFYNRYIAARIPAELIGDKDKFLSVRIDMSKQNNRLHFREIGTHDLQTP